VRYLDDVSPSIRERAVEVFPGLSDEVAFPPHHAKLAVAELAAENIAILGGDGYSAGPTPRPTHRNWYVNRATAEDWKGYVERSRHTAINAIEALASDSDTLIVLVCATEDEHRKLRKHVSFDPHPM
jgi:hypothetical protein